MAHITEFVIEGLAGRTDEYSGKLNRDVNVFFGLNGSGKTSLLKILHSAMSGDATILKTVPFKRAEVKIYSVNHKRIFTRSLSQSAIQQSELVFGSDPDEDVIEHVVFEGNIPKWITKPASVGDNALSHRWLPISRLYISRRFSTTSGVRVQSLSEDELDQRFARIVQDLWRQYSTDILSTVRKVQDDGLANILNAILSSKEINHIETEVDADTAYKRVSAFLKRRSAPSSMDNINDFRATYESDSRLRSVVSDINEVEQKIEESMAPRNRLQEVVRILFSGNKSIEFTDNPTCYPTNE